jgi:hypothetical protein
MERALKYVELLSSSLVALIGVGFFFAIVGVFGLSVAITALAVFVAIAIWIFVGSKQITDAGQ